MDNPWWHFLIEVDFYIHFILGGVGLLYAIWAYNAAERADKAAKSAEAEAKKAAENAKILSSVIDISQLITSCNNIPVDLTFEDASSKNTELASKIRKIISFYRRTGDEDLDAAGQAIIQTLDSLRASLNTYDEAAGITVYRTIEPHFSNLSIYISEYSGVLERKQLNTK